jgi:hypothetical protein
MAFRGGSSFDCFGTGNMTDFFVSTGVGSIVAGQGRCGSAAWRGTAADGSGPVAGVNATTLSGFCGFAGKPEGFSTTAYWEVLRADGTVLAFLIADPSGRIEGWKGANTILGTRVCQTGATQMQVGHYTAIGVEWLISTSGYLRIYINGTLAANSGTVDMTTFFSSGQWGALSFTPVGYIDDLYWGDTDTSDPLNPWAAYLGDLHAEGQLCLTDAIGGGGTFREWTPSTGTDHGALLDENPPDGDTSYVASQTVTQRESVKFSNIIPNTGSVYAIQHLPYMEKTSFAARTIQVGAYVSATESYQTAQSPGQTNYRYYPALLGYNPVAAAPWSIATANSEEALIKIAS